MNSDGTSAVTNMGDYLQHSGCGDTRQIINTEDKTESMLRSCEERLESNVQ